MGFKAHDRYDGIETDSLLQDWRKGATLAGNNRDSWFQTN